MISNKKFKNVSLVKNGLILIFKSNRQKEIPISELDKVYITVDKIAPIYTFCYIFLSVAFMLFSLWYVLFDMILIIPLIMIIALGIKLNDYKSYGLEICLKNGDYFKKQVPSELKYDTIDVVNCIRKEIYTFSIEKNETNSFSHQRVLDAKIQTNPILQEELN